MLEQIKTAFTEIDKKMLDTQMEWAMGRMDALKEYSENYNRKTDGSFGTGAIKVSGGTTWYKIFMGSNKQMVAEYITKNVQALIEKRNARIVAAISKKGITEIPSFEIKHDGQGYEGMFKIGEHTVTINTILAGGYHIQCLHQRTLVKVKEAA